MKTKTHLRAFSLFQLLLAIVIMALVASMILTATKSAAQWCAAHSPNQATAAPDEFPLLPYNCREVILNGRRYLIQKQDVGYMRGTEWRVVAGPLL